MIRIGSIIAIAMLIVGVPVTSFAMGEPDLQAIQLHTAFFDQGFAQTSSCGSGTGVTVLSGSGNEDQIWNYLIAKGLQPFQAAGVMGNMQSESGFNPASQEPGTTSTTANSLGHGIVQWTPGTQLNAVAQAAGTDINNLGMQLDYLWSQLYSPTGSRTKAGADLKASTNVTQATQVFEDEFEIHAGPPQPARVTQAIAILAQYGSGASPNPGASGGTTSTATSGCGGTTPGEYQNPLRAIQNLVPERVDAGVDYSGTGTLYALGTGTISYINAPPDSGWGPDNIFIAEQLSDGPAAGKIAYIAECITPDPSLHVTEKVTSSTVIGQMTNCGSGIETGWSTGGDIALGKFNGSNSTAAGENYSQLLQSLGAPPGITNAPVTGALPDGWPTW